MLHKAAATRQVQRYDEPETLSYQILQFSAIGADGGHLLATVLLLRMAMSTLLPKADIVMESLGKLDRRPNSIISQYLRDD